MDPFPPCNDLRSLQIVWKWGNITIYHQEVLELRGGHDEPEKFGNEQDCLLFVRYSCGQEIGSKKHNEIQRMAKKSKINPKKCNGRLQKKTNAKIHQQGHDE